MEEEIVRLEGLGPAAALLAGLDPAGHTLPTPGAWDAVNQSVHLPGLDVPAFELPPGLADASTIGIIFDFTDGLNFYPEYGATLMRSRKAWYYRREPRPGVTVIGDRLLELAFAGRR